MELNYENDLEIDEYHLDKEWLQQPMVFMRYSEKAAEADRVKKKVKEHLDIVQAEVDMEVRGKAAEDGEKVTEKVVSSRVLLNEHYQEALGKLSQAEYEYAIMMAAVRAMDQRKAALENLVKLSLAGYYSSPVQKDKKEEDKDFKTEASSKTQREALNKGKKKRVKKTKVKEE